MPSPARYTVELADTPPSLNRLGRSHPLHQHRVKRDWQNTLGMALLAAAVPRPLPGPVTATARLRYPVRRRRDEGNLRWLLEKALGDTLHQGGWLPDDTPDHYLFGRVTFDPDRGAPRTTLTITIDPRP